MTPFAAGTRHILIRLYAEQRTETAAQAVAERLRTALEPQLPAVTMELKGPYWKIPGYHEIWFSAPVSTPGVTPIMDLLGTGWISHEDQGGIWNSGPGTTFIEPSVRWAEVMVIETPANSKA